MLDTEIWFKLEALLNKGIHALNKSFSATTLTAISTSGFKTFILQRRILFYLISYFVFVLNVMEMSSKCIYAS